MPRERIISAETQSPDEARQNYALRPQTFEEYIGQEELLRKLRIAVEAARGRGDPVGHTLLHGPPGLGKTTLARVIANEMGAKVYETTGPALSKPADIVGILNRLARGDVLFIDEIHRIPAAIEEYLYSAMEDFKIDITLEAGVHARAITLPLPPFTLIGATTRLGSLTGPMRDRFGNKQHLEFYSPESLFTILKANAALLKLTYDDAALQELSRRSRGTPRIANRLLYFTRDFAAVEARGKLTLPVTQAALKLEGIDDRGLDAQDRQFLRTIIEVYEGGPVGIEAMAATMGEETETLVDVIEPYLLQQAMVTRTRQGRRAARAAYQHLGIPYRDPPGGNEPPGAGEEVLFNDE